MSAGGVELRRYIHEHAIHKPSIVVLDTPTLGLEHQKSGDGLITSRDKNGRPRTGLLRNLFDCMVDTGEVFFGDSEDADRPGLLVDLRENGLADTQDGFEEAKLW